LGHGEDQADFDFLNPLALVISELAAGSFRKGEGEITFATIEDEDRHL
jgi:hypothetical protein